MLGGRILYGGDYNPDQWLEHPEVLEQDVRLMKESKVNCVSLGIFAWAALEPEEGVYQMDWLDRLITRMEEEDIQVILATPSAAMPHWLTQRYPEVMQVQADGRRNLPGKRHNFCYTSPVMREKTKAIDRELSRRFGRRKNVILWHISNELGGNFADSVCYCEYCQAAFRKWLKKKYGTLQNLNQAWWNYFWSHNYTDWEQIHSPVPNGETTSTALLLDWRRFSTEQIHDFYQMEVQAVREYSELPATTNFMYFFKGLDYNRMKHGVDVISWDNYPFWHKRKDEVSAAVKAAANHNIMRALKRQPFLLMESTPSAVSWREYNPLKRPGMNMLAGMQAIAHGSDSVLYFQWRKGRGGYEKFHGAVLDHKNGTNTRVFREVTELGERLAGLGEKIRGTVNRPKAAILFDWENWWAVEDTQGPRLDIKYVKTILSHYRAFWEQGIEADLIGMDEPLDDYLLVSAPMNYLYKDGYADRVRAFVESGGVFVTTCFSGMVNETDLCFTEQHPLEDVLGVIQEEIDAPSEEFGNSFHYDGKTYPAKFLCEISHAKEDTEVLASYEEDFYAGYPAVTCHPFGKGSAFYLAAGSDQEFLRVFYRDVFRKAGVENALRAKLPYGVTTAERIADDGTRIVFVMNFKNEPVIVEDIGIWTDAETQEQYEDALQMKPFECLVLTKQKTNGN